MSGPPKDIPASTLWAKLQEMPRPHKVVDFPRTGPDGNAVGQTAMFVLTQEEQMICAAAAEKFAKEKLKDSKKEDIGYETIYSNEAVVQLLYRACKDAEDLTRSAFPSPSAIRQILTADECSVLFEQYLGTQLELGPIVADLTKDELDAWIEKLSEGGLAASPLAFASQDLLRILLISMASQLSALRKASSSAGSPPDEQPSDDELNK